MVIFWWKKTSIHKKTQLFDAPIIPYNIGFFMSLYPWFDVTTFDVTIFSPPIDFFVFLLNSPADDVIRTPLSSFVSWTLWRNRPENIALMSSGGLTQRLLRVADINYVFQCRKYLDLRLGQFDKFKLLLRRITND